MSFKNLGLQEPLLRALQKEGYVHPTPIQTQAIPSVLHGSDIQGCAQTGTGKTAAFSLPILQLLAQNPAKNKGIRALILTPTRELAIQIEESLTAYGKYLNIQHTAIFGGVSQVPQVSALRRGVDIVVATPGRLLDLISQGFISLRDLEIFVLDEADRMLEMGFVQDVKKIIALLPARRQSLFFSATMSPEIQQIAATLLTRPKRIEVTPPASTVDKIDQRVYFTNKSDKIKLLLQIIEDQEIDQALVFSRTKHGANKIVRLLESGRVKASAIHGNKSQTARQNALSDFKKGKIQILVATDIAARGIDIDELQYVFNYDLPNVPETYVHRIGRTGRAGHSGIAISFCDQEERQDLQSIQKLINIRIPVVEDHGFQATHSVQTIVQNNGTAKKPFNRNKYRSRQRAYSGSR